ncbi:hypothetical protein [uncultured Fibrobacter sp.]|uniref:hypothetical protein n=1 Tax=uncultured Fibrobacter sp. TaxID=261512 RepID=UPI0025CE819E|nr:hypothetical protein [uncultured Fibrobacter sp.]
MRCLCFLCILLWSTWAFAGPCVSQTTGMQVAVDNTPIATILENTINISGIVVETNFNYGNTAACQVNGPTPKCQSPIVYFASKESYGHVAILRDFRIDSEEKNAMYNAVDSSWIIYPEELNLQVGDSLYIKNYSAVYSYLFNEKFHCDLPPKMYATGEYFVNPTEDILATPRSRVLKVEKPKIHNRDAGGRCVNDKKRNVIRY